VNGISVTPDDVLKARGLSGRLTDMTLEISPFGGHLVAVAQFEGCNVCWGCCEPFDFDGPNRMIEVKPGGGSTPVGLHAKCLDPKARKIFSDMASNRLQTVEEVSAALRVRRLVSRVAKPFDRVKQAAKKLLIGI